MSYFWEDWASENLQIIFNPSMFNRFHMPENQKLNHESIVEMEKRARRIRSSIDEIVMEADMTGSDFEELKSMFGEIRRKMEGIRSNIKIMRREAGVAGLDFEEMMTHTGMAGFSFKNARTSISRVRSCVEEAERGSGVEVLRVKKLLDHISTIRSYIGKHGGSADMTRSVFDLLEVWTDRFRAHCVGVREAVKGLSVPAELGISVYRKVGKEVETAKAVFKKLVSMSYKTAKKPPPWGTQRSDSMEDDLELIIHELGELEKYTGAMRDNFEESKGYILRLRSEFEEMRKSACSAGSGLPKHLGRHEDPQAQGGVGRQGSVHVRAAARKPPGRDQGYRHCPQNQSEGAPRPHPPPDSFTGRRDQDGAEENGGRRGHDTRARGRCNRKKPRNPRGRPGRL